MHPTVAAGLHAQGWRYDGTSWYQGPAMMVLHGTRYRIGLDLMMVYPNHQGQGWGGRALSALMKTADTAHLPLVLEQRVMGTGLSVEALTDFYRRRGFQA